MVSLFIAVLRGEPDIGILEQKRMSVTGVSIGGSSFQASRADYLKKGPAHKKIRATPERRLTSESLREPVSFHGVATNNALGTAMNAHTGHSKETRMTAVRVSQQRRRGEDDGDEGDSDGGDSEYEDEDDKGRCTSCCMETRMS